jgi:NADH:ubiquinone reductase (H+-translocating)
MNARRKWMNARLKDSRNEADVHDPALKRRHGMRLSSPTSHRVVVVGGGFGGLSAARRLRRGDLSVTLVDRRNFHLFQPLLYQVATGALAAGEIATPLRANLKRRKNVQVVLGEVTGFDLAGRKVVAADGSGVRELEYDTLIVAGGATHAYFGHGEWAPLAPALKTIEDALEIRRRILLAFELAETLDDPVQQASWLTFVVVGGGPTGVELAGQIAEIARDTLRRDFRTIDPRSARVVLVEGEDRVLPALHPRLSVKAKRSLERLGVTVQLDRLVTDIDPRGVTLQPRVGPPERIASGTVIWAAGVRASELARALAEQSGAELDRAGRITVSPQLTLPGHPEVFALGDMVRVSDGNGGVLPLPGVAPTAMQQGRYAARVVTRRLGGKADPGPFRYRDKGDLATIGRLRAVGSVGRVRLSGFVAWLAWLSVHLYYLAGLQNRLHVFIRWTASFVTRGRGARLITGEGAHQPVRQEGAPARVDALPPPARKKAS